VIVVALFQMFGTIVGWFARLLPDMGLPGFSATQEVIGDSRVWTYWGWANHYLPVDLALLLFTARMVVWAVLHGLDALDWIVTKLHIFGGSS